MLMNSVINDKYKLVVRVGGGSFGDVYIGRNVITNDKVAIKIEDTHNDHEDRLSHEYKINKLLSDYVVVPNAQYYGAVDNRYNAMVMELMGPSLEDLFYMCKRKFSLKTILMLGKQMLGRLETMHKQGWVHRDIKPDNFAMGVENGSDKIVHILDFGLAKRFKYEHKNVHVRYKDGRSQVIGTARYTSINSHIGIEQSRRDDLEALGYTLVYFFRGKLPWQGIVRDTTHEKYHEIYCQKDRITIEDLCKGMPKKFIDYFDHVYNLDYTTKPDYKMLRQLFKDMLAEKGFIDDNDFEWFKKPEYLKLIRPRMKSPPAPVLSTPQIQSKPSEPKKRKTKSQKKREAFAAGKPIKLKPKYICKADRERFGITTKTIPRNQLKLYCV